MLAAAAPAAASVTTPQKSLRALLGRQVWVPICSRRGVNGSAAWFDGANTAVMDQVSCVAPSFGSVTALKVMYAAFDMPQQGEVDRPVTATGTASIYVPGTNTFTVFGNGSVPAGSTVLSFSATGLGSNAISVGQTVSSTGGGIAIGTYVVSVANSFAAGAGNTSLSTAVTLSAGTTAATASGQPFLFSGGFAPVKFGGHRQFVVEPGHDVVTSDATGVELSPGQQFFVRNAVTFSGIGLQLMDYPGTGSRLAGEFDARGTTLNDQTMTPASLANTGGGFWCPVAILGLVTPSAGQIAPGAVLVLGDSIAAGTGDTADALGLQGYIQRSLENATPFITAARGSTTAFGLAAHGDGQYALSVDSGITDVLLEDGRNDISSFQSSDIALRASIAQIAGRYAAAGKRVWCFTIPPTTQSNDGWTTLANQSWTVAVDSTGSSTLPAGSVTLAMQSVANVAVGQTISGVGIGAGTVVASVAGSSIGLSVATTAAIAAGSKLSFGSGSALASPSEGYRLAFNGFLRTQYALLGCSGVIDDDSVFADLGGSGKWRVDLGSASADGVHPSPALHQAAVNAGLITGSKFLPQ
jgi:hypothetical protein